MTEVLGSFRCQVVGSGGWGWEEGLGLDMPTFHIPQMQPQPHAPPGRTGPWVVPLLTDPVRRPSTNPSF